MKKAFTKIIVVAALLVLTPFMGGTTLKAADASTGVLADGEVRTGVVVQINLGFSGSVVFVQDLETGYVYTATCTEITFCVGDNVSYVKDTKKPKGNIIIKDVVKTNQ